MNVKIFIPTPLRQYTDKREVHELPGMTVGEVLRNLVARYPQVRHHLYADDGSLRSFVNVYVNDEDIRYLKKEQTSLKATDVISIIPSIAGGIDVDARAVVEEVTLTKDEMLRYSRHLVLPEVGLEGQKKLKAASVLIIGAGGLGSPAGLYLAAAGVGKIGIVDFDVVDLTNLQRQILHSTKEVGRSKLASARERLADINPHINIELYETRLTSQNALDILKEYDVVVDGTDNFPTRYLVNDACVLLQKPYVYGSIFRFDGQVSVFDPQRGPCYRCLYPSPPPPGLVPNCAEGGVLGVLPGIIGSLQALEAMKLIISQGELLVGRLLLFDALKGVFRELKLRKNPECVICGEHPTIHQLIDYEQFCGGVDSQQMKGSRDEEYQITPQQLKTRLDAGEDIFILDVREPYEYQICNLGGYLIPLNDLPKRVHELDVSKEIIVHCKMGGRSGKAVEFLKQEGFTNIKNLVGGIDRWAEVIDTSMPRY